MEGSIRSAGGVIRREFGTRGHKRPDNLDEKVKDCDNFLYGPAKVVDQA